jgi:signal transduction histidine kinase
VARLKENLDELTFARSNLIQEVEDMPAFVAVNIVDIVNNILRDRDHTLAERAVELSLNMQPFTLYIWEQGLHQVLSNLIDNAIEYSRDAKPPRLEITAMALDGVCRVRVSDNGIGIGFDMKHHDQIFGLFNRLVRANEFEDAGLAIARNWVEKLGGSISAESSPGQGASFIVELPMIHASEQP